MPITSFVEGDESVESKGLSGIGYIMLARNVMNGYPNGPGLIRSSMV